MFLPPKLKNFLIIVAKNGINALMVNTGAWLILPANFNLHNHAAEWNILKLAAWVIWVREAIIWGPPLLKWTQTNASPDDLNQSLDKAAEATKKASAAIQDAKSAVSTPAEPEGK